MQAIVNKIIPFSSVDGPGNRTAIFLQGCNIDCKYCHNPETRNICKNCGTCLSVCKTGALSMKDKIINYNRELCVNCDMCIKNCPNGSSPKTELMTPEEVFEQVKKQVPFIRGITVSGGECTLRPEFLKELFALCKEEGLTTLIDSNGTNDFHKLSELLKVTDGVMLDIKAFDEVQHKAVTGYENDVILKNAVYLAEQGKLSEVRTVVVPELFDAEDTIRNTAKMLAPFLEKQSIRYKLIAYRPMGVREEYKNLKLPDRKLMEKLAEILKEEGFCDIVII